jgi:hypothetical protein
MVSTEYWGSSDKRRNICTVLPSSVKVVLFNIEVALEGVHKNINKNRIVGSILTKIVIISYNESAVSYFVAM